VKKKEKNHLPPISKKLQRKKEKKENLFHNIAIFRV
jgi:hypothetical protein